MLAADVIACRVYMTYDLFNLSSSGLVGYSFRKRAATLLICMMKSTAFGMPRSIDTPFKKKTKTWADI